MRILFLSSWFPYPPINGAKIRIYNLLRELANHHEVTLLAFAKSIPMEEANANISVLEQYCNSVDVVSAREFIPRKATALRGAFSSLPRSVAETQSPEMENLLQQKLAEGPVDAVIASEVGAPGISSLLASKIPNIPRVLDALEIGLYRSAYYDESDPVRRLRCRMTWMKQRRFTKEMLGLASACTVPSLQELGYIRELASDNLAVEVIPHSLDLTHYTESYGPPLPTSLVFTGSFTYHANADAALHFLEEIYPLVKSKTPQVQLNILGNTAGADLQSFPTDESVIFSGLIKDVRPVVARSWLSVVPLRIGAGTRLKIIESMALGTPVVSTRKGAEGLEVTHGENILLADCPKEFADAISQLIHEPELRQALSVQGRKLVAERYNAAVMGQQIDSLLQRVVDASRMSVSVK